MNMKKEYIWTCDYCGKEFKTKKPSDAHELMCTKRKSADPIKIKTSYLYAGGIIFILFLGWLFLKPSPTEIISYQPTPTADPDPYTMCNWNKDDKGNQVCADKRMRHSECTDSVCCNLGNGTWAPLGKVECATTQAEINSKKPVYVRQPVKVDLRQMQPPNVSCNYDLAGNWVCRPSY